MSSPLTFSPTQPTSSLGAQAFTANEMEFLAENDIIKILPNFKGEQITYVLKLGS